MADSTPATNASNATRYYNLPLFLSSDRPSWLVDWNGAMNEIDTILNDIAIESEGASGAVATIQTQINTLSTTVENLNSIVETAVADVASMQTTVDSMEDRLDNVESDLITQNNLIKTLSDTVVAMQSTVSTLNNHVNVMEQSVTTLGANVEAIQTALTGLQSDVSSINSSLSSLNTRVTALENAGVSGMPALSDLTFTNTTFRRSDFPASGGGTKTHTLSEDSYVYVTMVDSVTTGSLGAGVTTTTGSVSLANNNVISVADTAPCLASLGTGFVDLEYTFHHSTGLFKLKAGDAISVTLGRGGSDIVYETVIHIAPAE